MPANNQVQVSEEGVGVDEEEEETSLEDQDFSMVSGEEGSEGETDWGRGSLRQRGSLRGRGGAGTRRGRGRPKLPYTRSNSERQADNRARRGLDPALKRQKVPPFLELVGEVEDAWYDRLSWPCPVQ